MLLRSILSLFLAIGCTASLLAQAAVATGERYALLVAVREYPKAKLGNLRFVENDLDELAAALKATGYKEDNLVQLSQTIAGQQGPGRGARFAPTGENIRRELRVLLGSLGKNDSVVVAFAGHGVQFQGQKESYLCPSDADLEQPASLLAVNDLYAQLKAAEARVKVFLVDACRNDPVLATSRGPRGVELEAVGRPQEIEAPQGIVALFSCSAGQKAWEDTELRHGVFFNFVIAGLKGEADKDQDRQVTYNELAEYSIAEVKRHARVKLGELQVPLQRGEFEGQIALARVERRMPPLAVAPFDAAAAKRHQTEWASYLSVQPVVTNSLNMKLVLVPPGEFMMGSPPAEVQRDDDERLHRVRITKPYLFGQTEVTVGQFRAFVADTKYETVAQRHGGTGYNAATQKFDGYALGYRWDSPGWKVADDQPVGNITLADAMAFCAWLSRKESQAYFLPAEAEWEWACRAGTTGANYLGNNSEDLVQIANIFDGTATAAGLTGVSEAIKAHDAHAFASPVGRFRPNAFGLYDMLGNIREHCSDWYRADYYDSLAGQVTHDPQGAADGGVEGFRVLRGGAFNSGSRGNRCADRMSTAPDFRSFSTGFRVVRKP